MLDHQQKMVEIVPHEGGLSTIARKASQFLHSITFPWAYFSCFPKHKRNGLLSSLIPYHPSQVQVRV
uniref:Uncharacterized protein n=1 Tax=Populus trichocarpa TaxID=3694 RepID=U5GUA1_POPTR